MRTTDCNAGSKEEEEDPVSVFSCGCRRDGLILVKGKGHWRL